jgi:hypothetical protein
MKWRVMFDMLRGQDSFLETTRSMSVEQRRQAGLELQSMLKQLVLGPRGRPSATDNNWWYIRGRQIEMWYRVYWDKQTIVGVRIRKVG